MSRERIAAAGRVLGAASLALALLLGAPVAGAASRFAVASGAWTAAATWSGASCGGAGGAGSPGNNDDVTICAGRTVTVNTATSNLATVVVQAGALLQGDGAGGTLRVGRGGGADLANAGTINFSGATAATIAINRDSEWNGAGTWNLSDINLSNRTLSFTAGSVLTLNLSAAVPIVHAPGNGAVINPAAPAQVTWNFNGTVAQSLPPRAQIQFGTIRVNNASATGVTLGTDLTAAAGNLNGSVLVQSGVLTDGGFAIAGPAGGAFRISPGARFRVMGSSNRLSGFGVTDYGTTGACGTVDYAGAAQVVSPTPPVYGNLTLSGSGAKTLPAALTSIACDFRMSGASTAGAAGPLAVGRNVTLDAGTLFDAAAYTHTVGGDFSNDGSFSGGASVFDFNGSSAQAISGAATVFNDLRVSNTTAPVTALTPFTVAGTLSIAAAGAVLSDGGNTVTVQGNVAVTGNHTGTGRLLLRNGLVAHVLSGPGSVNHLELDDLLGAALGSDLRVGGTLTLTSGLIGTGSFTLVTTASCNAPSVVRTAGYVNGRLQKRIPAGSSSCWFEVGSDGDYAPILVAYGAGTTAGSLTAYTRTPDHPNIGGAGLNPARSANRYWTLAPPGSGSLPAGTFSATFHFVAGNLDPGANAALFEVRRFNPPYPGAGVWSAETAGSRTGTSTQGLGIALPGDFAVGEPGNPVFSREKEFIFTRELY